MFMKEKINKNICLFFPLCCMGCNLDKMNIACPDNRYYGRSLHNRETILFSFKISICKS